MDKRINWIDSAKVFGMFLVIFGHTMQQPPMQWMKICIYSFHMPLFFFLSGFLYKQLGGVKIFTNTWRQLVIPLLFFNCLELLPILLKSPLTEIPQMVCRFIVDLGISLKNGDPLVGPSWFVLCLIWMRFLLYFSLRLSERIKWLLLFTCGIILLNGGLALLGQQDALREFCLSNALLAFPFYSLGYIMKQNYQWVVGYWHRYKWTMLFGMLVVSVLGVGCNGMVSIQSCTIGRSVLLMYAAGFSGTFISIWLCSLLKKSNRIIYILSCGTIVILCTHGFMLNQTVNKYAVFEVYSCAWYLYAFTVSAVVLLLEIPIILFFFRYLSWSVGGRKLVL